MAASLQFLHDAFAVVLPGEEDHLVSRPEHLRQLAGYPLSPGAALGRRHVVQVVS